MSLPVFPTNPQDGMIFEVTPGTFYIYSAGSNCWNRFDGADALGLATPLEDGLMAKEDFAKLRSLLVPPPQSSLQGEECESKFSSGIVALYSFDESLSISASPDVINKINGEIVGGPIPWALHKNTAGLDFRVDISNLLNEIEARGLLNKVQLQGEKGEPGKKGTPGIDKLDTGPVGPTGPDGANTPFAGSLTTEPISFEKVDQSSNRAVVDIKTEEVSATESRLVVTRANIGNPDACPNELIPKDIDSELLVVLNTVVGGRFVRNHVVQSSSGDCSLICRICASSIHHVNFGPIVSDIIDKYKDRIRVLKSEKEELVLIWLQTMIEIFNQQKQALCCALENCKSRGRNQSTRQYIETQRIQAAIGDFSLKIDGENDKVITKMDTFKDCPVPLQPANSVIFKEGGVIFNLDAKIHIADPRIGNSGQSLAGYLPPGTYIAEITNCCANFNQSAAGSQFSGHTAILYQAATVVGDTTNIESSVISFPDLGSFGNRAAAVNAYLGVTVSFEHAGGDVSTWLLDPDGFVENNNEGVQVCIIDILQLADDPVPPAGLLYAYRNEVATENFIGKYAPFVGGSTAADNLGIGTDGNVVPISGPDLSAATASNFFYLGTDGLHFNFVAGEPPGPGVEEIEASIQVRFEITNNPLAATIVAQNPSTDIKQLSATEFSGEIGISSSAGFVVGPIDPSSDFSVVFDPSDLDTMRVWNVSDDDNDLALAEGSTEGIGPQTNEVRSVDATALFDLSGSGVSEEFGGGNQNALQVENNISGQNVSIHRPIAISIGTTRTRTPPLASQISPPFAPPFAPPIVPQISPPFAPPTFVPPASPPATPITPFLPPPVDTKGVPLLESGEPIISEEDSTQPRGAEGTPQDPGIQDTVISISGDTIASARYIFTDDEGNKYYSAYNSVDPGQVGTFSFLSLGPPILVVAPPEVFTETVINAKNIEVSELSDLLTRDQLQKAESLQGISRLTFVQEILGTTLDRMPNARDMVDFEIEFQNSAVGFQLLGTISIAVGLPGAITNVVIDNFGLADVPVTENETEVLGRTKRVVAQIGGTDAANGGLLFVGLDSYYGDYQGKDTVRGGVPLDFQGNNFFLANTEGQSRVMQVTGARGFKDIRFAGRELREVIIASDSGIIRGDAVLVSDFGTVYIADGRGGVVYAMQSRIPGNNFYHGDAHDQGSNTFFRYVIDLPKSSVPPVMTFGRKFMQGGVVIDEILANFNGQWFKFRGVSGIQWGRGANAFRADVTTPRCCFGDKPPNHRRVINRTKRFIDPRLATLGLGPGGNSFTTDRDANPQLAFPRASQRFSGRLSGVVQAQLDVEFNQFSFFSLDDRTIYKVTPETGAREVVRVLPDSGIGLRIHPITKDFYYIVNDGGTTIPSGRSIRRVDISDLDGDGVTIIKTVYVAEGVETISSITFGNTLPANPDFSDMALFALVSNLNIIGSGNAVTARLIEISESPSLEPGTKLASPVPTNTDWLSSGTGGNNPNSIGGNPNRIIFSNIAPGSGCQMFHKQVQWYERGWRIGACCGALVELNGTYYIIVKRSIGIDTTCGGGESEKTACIKQFIDSGEGHPAIAWPTVMPVDSPPGGGGEEFLGLPTSGYVSFVKDKTLSDSLLDKISSGKAKVIKGNPTTEIPFILFPALM